uniref:Uncharacterized protein n=1 Tax=Rhizophora mucronata TaxID=61149 RepID=A0A2P2N6E5_RHIMU
MRHGQKIPKLSCNKFSSLVSKPSSAMSVS